MSTLPASRPRTGVPVGRLWERREAVVAVALAVTALGFAWNAGVKSFDPVPDLLRVVAAAGVLTVACGYAVTRLLLPVSLRAHFPLFVPAVGAPIAAFGLTVLGFLRSPIELSLALLIAGGTAAGLYLRLRGGPVRAEAADLDRAGPPRLRLAWPVYVAALAVAVSLIPLLQTGFVTTTGQNGDAVLAAGTAEFLQKSPPRGENVDLYVDRMPANWRSKYPIYYALAGVSELSGLDSTQVLSTVMSLMVALVAAGFFLMAHYTLGLGPAGALLAMGLVAFSRIVLYLGVQPFYNQIWGVFALPMTILLGFHFLRRPGRGSAVLLALFLALAAFAYPLMLPFPALLLGTSALIIWLRHRRDGTSPEWIAALDLPRLRHGRIAAIVLGLLAGPFLVFGLLGAAEKIWAAAQVVVPGSNLIGWNALPFYIPFHRFVGLVDPGGVGLSWVLVAAIVGAAFVACRRLPREVGMPLAATLAGALLVGLYFRIRTHGAFFYFKDLSFLGPLLTVAGCAGLLALARERSRALRMGAVAALALTVVATGAGARLEVINAGNQLTPQLLEVREWSRQLPATASVMIDLPRGGNQLWADYMLADRPISANRPLVSITFPSPPYGTHADYLLAYTKAPVSRRLVDSAPIRRNRVYALYRMRPDAPGPDNSSRRLVESFVSPLGR